MIDFVVFELIILSIALYLLGWIIIGGRGVRAGG